MKRGMFFSVSIGPEVVIQRFHDSAAALIPIVYLDAAILVSD